MRSPTAETRARRIARRIVAALAPLAPAAPLALSALGACRTVDARAWNLNQLHDENGAHQYSGALEDNFEYFVRNVLARDLLSSKASFAEKSPGGIKDPVEKCVEQLVKLEGNDADDPIDAGVQVEWFARLAVDDPSQLARERCVLALGRHGKKLSAGKPVKLPKDVTPSRVEATSKALAGLVGSMRPRIQRGGALKEDERAALESAVRAVIDLPLDIEGARRALRVCTDLMRAAGSRTRDIEPLYGLSEKLRASCVRQALAHALLDPSEMVRAAGVEAAVTCAGTSVLHPILNQLNREPSAVVLMRVLRVVRVHGLPEPDPALTPEEQARTRKEWLGAIYGLLLARSESEVHVAAMLALARVSGSGIQSLREEDWQTWWRAQDATPAEPTAAPSG